MRTCLSIAETKYSEGIIYVGKYNIGSSILVLFTPDRSNAITWESENEKDCNYFCDYLNKSLGSKYEFVVIKYKK